ncbi:hypothetical protein [Mangrovicoccus sp. HB161399]|uniref:hypothetical protein n=1 Tax=Mangrovicoccus sp. HB161399 TaxID=2720392 RepID=UPI0015553537|nr:hypothetical protein [Mangrovicoccus sp. HB161399]
MKYGWRLLLIPLWALCIAGAALTAFLAAGWIGWPAFALAAVLGLVLGIPGGLWNTRKVRRDDPAWP